MSPNTRLFRRIGALPSVSVLPVAAIMKTWSNEQGAITPDQVEMNAAADG